MAGLRIGETFIYGHTPDQARAICEAARVLAVDITAIRTTDAGFIVPDAVADEFNRMQAPTWAPEAAVF
jgi:hypothetical protein